MRLLPRGMSGGLASLGDHLIEPAVEPRQRIGHAILRARIGDGCAFTRRRGGREDGGGRRRARLREASLSHALELSRQVVETVVDGSEVFLLVVHLIPICSAPVPHAFLRPLGWITQELFNFPGTGARYEGSAGTVLKPRANSCLSW